MLIDAGCEYKGYAGDITRTFPVNGKFTQPSVKSTTLCWSLLKPACACIVREPPFWKSPVKWCVSWLAALVKLGILKGDVDELIAQNAHRPFFMHGLSHWLGLDVHDVGVYGQDRSRILEPGMVLTVELVCISRRMRMCQNNIAVSAFVLKTTL